MYGSAEFSAAEMYERKIADKFISWGWSEKDIKSNIIFESQNLRRIPNRQFSKKILLVLLSNPKYTHLLDSTVVGSQLTKYFSNLIDFIDLFDDDIYSNLCIRTNKNDWNWKIKKNISEKFRKIVFDKTNKPFLESVAGQE